MVVQKTKRLVSAVVNRLGLLDVYSSFKKGRLGSEVVVVMYHRVSPCNDRWSLDALSPQVFEGQLEYLSRNYSIVSLDRISQYIDEGKPLPKRTVAVTLDDGYKDNFLYAFPLLKKYHVPATIFLTTGNIDSLDLFWWDKVGYTIERTHRRRIDLGELGGYVLGRMAKRRSIALTIIERLMKLPEQRKNLLIEELLHTAGVDIPESLAEKVILSWAEVLRMSKEGMDFGAHSVSHPILTNLPLEKARFEIVESKRNIEGRVKPVRFFSYPNGVFSSHIVEAVKQSGFVGAVTCDPVWVTCPPGRYRTSRMVITSEDFNMFRVMLSGIWGDYKRFSKLWKKKEEKQVN